MHAFLGTDEGFDCRGLLCKSWGCTVCSGRTWGFGASGSQLDWYRISQVLRTLLHFEQRLNRLDVPLLLLQRTLA